MSAVTNQLLTKGVVLTAAILALFGCVVARAQEVSDGEREQIRQQMRSIIIPKLEFDGASLEEAVEFLNQAAAELNPGDETGQRRALEMRVRRHFLADGDASAVVGGGERATITLSLEKIPLDQALEFCAAFGGCAVAIAPPADEIESCVEIVSVYFQDENEHEDEPVAAELQETRDRDGLITREFAVPRNFIKLATAPDLEMIPDPFVEGSVGNARDRFVWPRPREIFVAAGVTFPEGASVTLDTDSRHLIVRNTEANLELVQIYVDSIWDQVPAAIELGIEIYALPKLLALALADTGTGLGDRLREMASTGEAELVDRFGVAAAEGDRSIASSGREIKVVSGYMVKDGKDVAVEESVFLGSLLDASARLEEHDGGLQVEVALSKTFGEAEIIDSVVMAPISGKEMPIRRVLVDQAQIKTKVRLLSGESRLLATFSPRRDESDQACLVILRATAKKLGK